MPLLVEIKARCTNPEMIRTTLLSLNADFKGEDHQIDTYYASNKGRLKLRRGNIENTLIFYNRDNQAGPKTSRVRLYKPQDPATIESLLCAALEVKVVVDKRREIYFIGNVKFHIDEVEQLGSFVEIEAIDRDGSIGHTKLDEQCNHYLHVLNIQSKNLLTHSYSDMLLQLQDESQ